LELAKKAGIACAGDVAAGCNRPDEDERDAPSSFKKAAAMRFAASMAMQDGDWFTADLLNKEVDRLMRQAADWHFPAGQNGVVTPNSAVANAKVDKGIKDCDFKLFSEGLHTLQDSWSHQGKPFMEGLGHARGAEWVAGHWERYGFLWLEKRWVPGYWKKLDGLGAALSHSADDVTIWPADARAAASASYQKMLDFKAACPCACPGPNNTKVKTSSGDAEKDISAWLNQKYPGDNKVK
jgi:hypothetical protein